MSLIKLLVFTCSLTAAPLLANAFSSEIAAAHDSTRSNPIELYRAARNASFMGDRLLSYMSIDQFPDHLTYRAQKAVQATKDLAQEAARGSSMDALRSQFRLVEESVTILKANWHASDRYRSPTTDLYYQSFLESVDCMRVFI